MKKFTLPLLLLPAILIPLFVLSSIYADEAGSRIVEQATGEGAQGSIPVMGDYRQALRKVVEIKEEDFPQEIDYYLRYMPSRGAEAQSGKVGIVDSAWEYSYQVKVAGKLPIEFALGAGYVGIDNTTAVKLPSYLSSVAFGAETTLPFFNIDRTYFTIGLAPSFFTDNWDFPTSAFRLLQRYFFIYQPNEKWTFVAGVGVSPDCEDAVMPILGFIYKPNDRLSFNIVPKQPEISYALNEKLTVFTQADMYSGEYEVTKDNLKNVILEYNEVHLGAGLRYKFNKHIKGSFSTGGIFNRSLKYRPDSLGKVTIKDGLYSEFRIEIVM